MNFIWSEPPPHSPDCHCPKVAWDKVIISWLNYNDVWPKIDRDHWGIGYNYVWHFFDIYIYEYHLPGYGNNPRKAIEAMERCLSSTDLEWSVTSTWRWDTKKNGFSCARLGCRFMITASDLQDSPPTECEERFNIKEQLKVE